MSTFFWHSICVSPFSSIFITRDLTMTFSEKEMKHIPSTSSKRTLDVYLFLYSFSSSMCMYPTFSHIHHHQRPQQHHHHKFDVIYSQLMLLVGIFPLHCCYFRCLFPLIRSSLFELSVYTHTSHTYE